MQRGQRVWVRGFGGKEGELLVWESYQHGAGLCTKDGYATLMEGFEAPVVGFPTRDIVAVLSDEYPIDV